MIYFLALNHILLSLNEDIKTHFSMTVRIDNVDRTIRLFFWNFLGRIFVPKKIWKFFEFFFGNCENFNAHTR